MEIFRIGDVVDRPIYGRPNGAPAPMLLLAAGQRIDTEVQLRRLQEAGFSVSRETDEDDEEETAKKPEAPPAEAPRPVHVQPTFSQRMEAAQHLRKALAGATRTLLGRVNAGMTPDARTLLATSTMLAGEVAADPYCVAAVTHLQGCDDYTIEHSADVSILMVAVARLMGLPDDELRTVALGGLLHDVGKTRVPREIMEKTGPLTQTELAEVRKHPDHGRELLMTYEGCPESAVMVAYQHHERLDGGGYPNGCLGQSMHRHARIAAVANAFDSLTSDRLHRKRLSSREALLQVFNGQGAQYDPMAAAALVKLIGVYPVGTRVMLNSGESGIVVAPNPEDTSRPVVQIDRDYRSRTLSCPITVELQKADYHITGIAQA